MQNFESNSPYRDISVPKHMKTCDLFGTVKYRGITVSKQMLTYKNMCSDLLYGEICVPHGEIILPKHMCIVHLPDTCWSRSVALDLRYLSNLCKTITIDHRIHFFVLYSKMVSEMV
jgi:hypothetical protein